jgi:hypothetical protein
LRRTHPTIDTLELYSLERLLEPELREVEEHLLVCQDCRDSVTSLDQYHSLLKVALQEAWPEIHATEDGLIHNWVEPLPDGRCKAHHPGPTLDGSGEFDTDRQA